MKEYIAKTGGRYTYVDDLLNLQELAQSMTAIFDGCSNFIISGCEVKSGSITPGFVWLGGKVRYFEGCNDAAFPYYIYERNGYETISYAGDVNKQGRCNYLSGGSTSIPDVPDSVTGELPSYIEMRETYSPRFIDKFFGKYAVLVDSPFAQQTVKKDLVLAGNLTVGKDLECKTSVSVVNPENGYSLKNLVTAAGDASVGVYEHGLLVSEIVIGTDGSITLFKQGVQLARIDAGGLRVDNFFCQEADFGAVRIQGNHIFNNSNATDDGEVRVNRYGYNGGMTKYRNFIVYDGRTDNPLLWVEGKNSQVMVRGAYSVINDGRGIVLKNPTYKKGDLKLTNSLVWLDQQAERLGWVGYQSVDTFDLSLSNDIGNVVIASKGWVDVRGELRVGGVNIADTYVSGAVFSTEISRKVDKISGKGLSTEDFTTDYKKKLDSILTGSIGTEGEGFVTAGDVADALKKKLAAASNLADLNDAAKARGNLAVYSRSETAQYFLKTLNYLSEITSMTASEVEGKTPEEIIDIRQERQEKVRENIDAEKKGTGDLKLTKTSNLSDLPDKAKARQNIDVYSVAQIDSMLAGKLGSDQGYTGIPFTAELKSKLDGIKTGIFTGTDNNGVSQTQVEGYVTTSSVVKELTKYAPKLMGGYSTTDKATVASNLGLYTRTEADGKFAVLSLGLSDLVSYQVKQGKTTNDAKKVLRDNIGAAGTTDLDSYIRKDKKLADLTLGNENDKKLACQAIGAAYSTEYEKKIADTGWLNCGGWNGGTLWARQIGNVVCIQGQINTGKRDSNTWGMVATIPNQISPPRFGCRQTMADFNDDHKYNRGCSFIINAGSRSILMHERGTNNVTTNLSFSYMT